MSRRNDLKRKHHHVWAHYLRNWQGDSLPKGSLFQLTKKGRINATSSKGVACEKDFYKVNALGSDDLRFLKKLANHPENSTLREINQSFVQDMSVLSFASDFYKTTISQRRRNELKRICANAIEELHSGYEDAVRDELDRLARGDVSVLSPRASPELCGYLGLQITRTKAFKERALASEDGLKTGGYRLNLRRLWWALHILLGNNIGASLFLDEANFCLLQNESSEAFLTSDQPIVNIHQTPSKGFTILYPLSPRLALQGGDGIGDNRQRVVSNADEIEMLNRAIVRMAYKEVFADNEMILRKYRGFFMNQQAI
ncbi:DUF4238 domain-containing protein [Marinobacter maroccanus]|uniref:DUF4238 domain-containing protein n=1 Tax=Marinobacter maroccanus TaxID=2055143 RepID=UPI001304A5A2|nr:DUF4238 domain-containing protein [Marinobacter maroccanus]